MSIEYARCNKCRYEAEVGCFTQATVEEVSAHSCPVCEETITEYFIPQDGENEDLDDNSTGIFWGDGYLSPVGIFPIHISGVPLSSCANRDPPRPKTAHLLRTFIVETHVGRKNP